MRKNHMSDMVPNHPWLDLMSMKANTAAAAHLAWSVLGQPSVCSQVWSSQVEHRLIANFSNVGLNRNSSPQDYNSFTTTFVIIMSYIQALCVVLVIHTHENIVKLLHTAISAKMSESHCYSNITWLGTI